MISNTLPKSRWIAVTWFPSTVNFKQLSDRSWMIYLWQHQAAYSLMIPLLLGCSGLFFSICWNFLEVSSRIIPLLKRVANVFVAGLNSSDLCKYIKSFKKQFLFSSSGSFYEVAGCLSTSAELWPRQAGVMSMCDYCAPAGAMSMCDYCAGRKSHIHLCLHPEIFFIHSALGAVQHEIHPDNVPYCPQCSPDAVAFRNPNKLKNKLIGAYICSFKS